MAQYVLMGAGLAFLAATVWLLISLINMIRTRTRAKGKRGAVISLSTIVASFFTLIAASIFMPPAHESATSAEVPAPVSAATEAEASPDPELAVTAPAPTPRPVDANTPADEKPATRELLPTQEARLMCRALDQTGLASAPCSYSGWNSTITMTIDMTASEARNLCQMMVKYSRDNKMGLNGWRLEIRSPYSGNNSIAFCMLA